MSNNNETYTFCNDAISLGNRLGTCWNQAIQMILYFDDKTRNTVQNILLTKTAEEILNDSINIVSKIMPQHTLNSNGIIKNKYIITLINLINIIIKRFKIKSDDYDILQQSTPEIYETHEKRHQRRRRSFKCEANFVHEFTKIYDNDKYNILIDEYKRNEIKTKYGGNEIYTFFMLNLLSSLLLKTYINIEYIDIIDNTNDNVNDDILLYEQTLNSSNLIGTLLYLKEHVVSFYTCDGKDKMCDNNKILSYPWKEMMNELFILAKNKIKYKLVYKNINITDENGESYIFNTPVIIIIDENKCIKNIIGFDNNGNKYNIFYMENKTLFEFVHPSEIIKGIIFLLKEDNIEIIENHLLHAFEILILNSSDKNKYLNHALFLHYNKLLNRIYNNALINYGHLLIHYIEHNINFSKLILNTYNGVSPIIDMKLDYVDKNGDSILIHAAKKKDNYLVDKLLQFYSDNIMLKNNNNETVLDIAIKSNYFQIEILEILISYMKPIDINTNKNDYEVIHALIHKLLVMNDLNLDNIIIFLLLNKITYPINERSYFILLKMSLIHNKKKIFNCLLKGVNYYNNRIMYINLLKYAQTLNYFIKLDDILDFTIEEVNLLLQKLHERNNPLYIELKNYTT